MLAVGHSMEALSESRLASPLTSIHTSAISVHHAKKGYDYPIIRLPHTFSKLVGLSTSIYQTVHNGALAFLVIVAPAGISRNTSMGYENDAACSKTSVFTRRRSPVQIRPGPSFFCLSDVDLPSVEDFSVTRIVTRNSHKKDNKLHNLE